MIDKLAYALVLFVHPNTEPRVYATFATAEACRAERAAVIQDFGTAKITAACVPQNQVSMKDMSAHMQEMMRVMKETMNNIDKAGTAK
jgi:hypothetical protein